MPIGILPIDVAAAQDALQRLISASRTQPTIDEDQLNPILDSLLPPLETLEKGLRLRAMFDQEDLKAWAALRTMTCCSTRVSSEEWREALDILVRLRCHQFTAEALENSELIRAAVCAADAFLCDDYAAGRTDLLQKAMFCASVLLRLRQTIRSGHRGGASNWLDLARLESSTINFVLARIAPGF